MGRGCGLDLNEFADNDGGSVLPAMPEATYREIARKANVSLAAVSFAMRNRPGVSEATREHILRVAKECGYKTNPYVSALMSHKRAASPVGVQAILGLVSYAPLASGKAFPHVTVHEFLEGARKASGELGFALEEFLLPDLKQQRRNLDRLFYSRNMVGLIFHLEGPLPEWFSIDWNRYAFISIGHRVSTPCMNFVSANHLEEMRLMLMELEALGYRRIGFASTREWQELQGERYLSAYMGWHWNRKHAKPLIVDQKDWTIDTLSDWIRKEKPDLVISQDNLSEWLRKCGLRVPGDIGFAHPDLDPRWKGQVAGIRQSNVEVGTAVVRNLAGTINQSLFGPPSHPQAHLITGEWVTGASVRSQISPTKTKRV